MIDLLMILVVMAASAYALWSKDLVASVLGLGVAGAASTAYFFILQAPDVAMAEAAVGVGLIPLIFFIAISKTQRFEE